jgi:uncharacterized cupin superfamily protein
LSQPEVERFATQGYIGPKALLSSAQCALIMRYLRYGRHPAPPDWPKARGVVEPFLFDVATYPPLLAWLGQLLGSDIILWAVSVVERAPGQPHLWHTDIETSSPDARTATAWIGLEHISRHSALRFVNGSHRFGKPIQRAAHEQGLRRADLSEAAALTLARELDATSRIVEPEATEGDVLLFDGRIWHGSHNAGDQIRTALLVQFADARAPIRIPDFSTLEWPFRFHAQPRPPCISVAGSASHGINRLVAPPASEGGVALGPQFKKLSLPLEQDLARGWRPFPQFKGATRVLGEIGCHVSVLGAGRSPHPPHTHIEEEVLLVLDGEAELVIASGPDDATPRVERVQPGSFVYYPAFQHHTLRNPSQSPVTYLMFKWRSAPDETREPLPTQLVRLPPVADRRASFSTHVLFEGPTAFLGKLHVHLSELQPGGGYAAHVDAHDVAIVVLSGRIHTNGHAVGRHGVVHFPAGEPHDMRNTTTELARYLVFEFHSPRQRADRPRSLRARRSIARRLSVSIHTGVERVRFGLHRVARRIPFQVP